MKEKKNLKKEYKVEISYKVETGEGFLLEKYVHRSKIKILDILKHYVITIGNVGCINMTNFNVRGKYITFKIEQHPNQIHKGFIDELVIPPQNIYNERKNNEIIVKNNKPVVIKYFYEPYETKYTICIKIK